MRDAKDLTRSDTLPCERILQVRMGEPGVPPANQLAVAGQDIPKRRFLSVSEALGWHIQGKPSEAVEAMAGGALAMAVALGGWVFVASNPMLFLLLTSAFGALAVFMKVISSILGDAEDEAEKESAAGRGIAPGLRKCKAKRISKTRT